MKNIVVDSNVVVRFLIGDGGHLATKASNIFASAQDGKSRLYFDEIMVAEVCWVLSSYYEYHRSRIVDKMIQIMSHDWVVNPRKELVLRALVLWNESNTSFVDSWLHIMAKNKQMGLVTFDEKLMKIVVEN